MNEQETSVAHPNPIPDRHKELRHALKFLISEKGNPRQKLNRPRLKEVVDLFTNQSHHGLPSSIIHDLCFLVIFEDSFDIPTRRKLLYSCIPVSTDFPYNVFPLAVSSAAVPNISSTWQMSILQWVAGLLQFHIVSDTHELVHICYATFFNLLGYMRLCPSLCQILCQISRREDVTPQRVQVLFRLVKKNGFCHFIPHVLRIYKAFRPDLVISRQEPSKALPRTLKALEAPLMEARLRLQENFDPLDKYELLPLNRVGKNNNPYHEPNTVPHPEIIVYAETIEEKKKKKISVLQFKRVKEMISHMNDWKMWQWPNSSPCLLWKPVTIALFKPHDIYVKVAITNWLEIALRTEVIEQWGNPREERKENLLDACILLVKQTETLVPVVYHFMIELLSKWDRYSHMSRILELLSFFPFISPSSFFECILENFSQLLTTASLPLLCSFIDSFSNTCVTWALQAKTQGTIRRATEWGNETSEETQPLEGIFFLSQRLNRIFIAAILRLGPQSLLLNSCITYYNKVNSACDVLDLPLIVTPSFEFIFSVLASSDIVAIDRLGTLLITVRNHIQKLRRLNVSGDDKIMRSLALKSINTINFSVMVFLDSTVVSKGFSESWDDTLSNFISPSLLNEIKAQRNINHCFSVCRALQYVSLNAKHFLEYGDYIEDRKTRDLVINKTVEELSNSDLGGIINCAKTFISS